MEVDNYMETSRLISMVLWWLFLIVCIIGVALVFKFLIKKLQIKWLRYVGIAFVAFNLWMSVSSMVKLQGQINWFRNKAAEYRSSVSTSMDSSQIDAIQTHNKKVQELQVKAEEHPVIYWLMSGDYGCYEDYIVTIPE